MTRKHTTSKESAGKHITHTCGRRKHVCVAHISTQDTCGRWKHGSVATCDHLEVQSEMVVSLSRQGTAAPGWPSECSVCRGKPFIPHFLTAVVGSCSSVPHRGHRNIPAGGKHQGHALTPKNFSPTNPLPLGSHILWS